MINKSRNTKILLLLSFLAFVLASPFVLADAQQVELSNKEADSAYVYIKFTGATYNFRNGIGLRNVDAKLGPGTVFQIPSNIAIFNSDNTINWNKTMERWHLYGQYQRDYNGNPHFSPREWNCENNARSCHGVKDGELFFPIKVVESPNGAVNTESDAAYGFIAIDHMRNNLNPKNYQTIRSNILGAYNFPQSSLNGTVAGGDSGWTGGEMTTQGPRPQQRPEQLPSSVEASNLPTLNCKSPDYRPLGNRLQRESCLNGLNLKQRAEIAMANVLEINRLRKSFNLDVRVSACMAHRESEGINNNAKGGTPDWGMFQVTDDTGKYALRLTDPVVPGFSRYRYSDWYSYRNNMLNNILAQADLHHSVLKMKANQNGLITRINRGEASWSLYQKLAARYNGGGRRAENYGNKIANCYSAMKKISNRKGQFYSGVTNKQVQNALKKAKD